MFTPSVKICEDALDLPEHNFNWLALQENVEILCS
jgi:hypothetical protein